MRQAPSALASMVYGDKYRHRFYPAGCVPPEVVYRPYRRQMVSHSIFLRLPEVSCRVKQPAATGVLPVAAGCFHIFGKPTAERTTPNISSARLINIFGI